MNKGKIERAATRAVEEYIDLLPQLEPKINSNDKTPIWDGDIYIYDEERQGVKNFLARVPVQVKGTTNTDDDSYRIDREYIKAYHRDSGCVFFMVQEDKTYKPIRILYAMLSANDVNTKLQRNTQTIKIDLKVVPTDPLDFEKELIKFANERSREPIENPSPKEIAALVNRFKDIEKHLDEMDDKYARIDIEVYLKSIKELKQQNDRTIGWRDRFVHAARKVLDLTLQHVKGYDALNLQFELASYLHDQKLYHLVEDYYLQALAVCRERAKSFPSYKHQVAATLNSLAVLHKDLNQYPAAEKEYNEALEIRRKLAKDNPDAYLPDVAMTLNNLGNLHSNLNQFDAAEKEYKEALETRRKLANVNPDAYLPYVAGTLNNLAILHDDLNQYPAAEKEYKEALDIYRKLAKDNSDAYLPYVATTLNNLAGVYWNTNKLDTAVSILKEALEIRRKLAKINPNAYLPDVAMTLNNLAVLHKNLNQYPAAEDEYKEALDIRRELANVNPDAYLPYVATTLNNLAVLHMNLNQYPAAEKEYKEALETYRKLAKDNPNAYLPYVATTLNNLAILHDGLNQYPAAEKEYNEALEIRRELAKVNPDAYLPDVAVTLNNLAVLHDYLNQYPAAEKEYNEALEIRRELAKVNPDAYLGNVANTLYNMALLMMKDDQRKEEAKQACQESLDLYAAMAQKAPQRFNKDVDDAQRLLDLLNLLGDINKL